ncbi:MAG: biotin--[acetyl-CoA-carboxylase] ligase, partial [Bariatricus sp.]
LEPGNEYNAKALGIDDTGELIVEKEDKSRTRIFSGEVSVRGIYGYV